MCLKKASVATAVCILISIEYLACSERPSADDHAAKIKRNDTLAVDTTKIPEGAFGEAVRYGRELMLNTAYYIGPEGINGKYLGNKTNCTNCHQEAGTKPFSFNLGASHENYPQYRAREGKVLTLAERVNNCVMRPHNGRPLPLDSKEMTAFFIVFQMDQQFCERGNRI